MTRRLGVIALTCCVGLGVFFMLSRQSPRAPVQRVAAASLPRTDVGWVSMTDHFVATVGEHAGQGKPLGHLLVLADATFAPRSSFPLHPHQDMEILSLVLHGTLTHKEPNAKQALPEGAVQVMSARDGIFHAEANETDAPTRMLQVWIEPNEKGGPAVHRVFAPVPWSRDFTKLSPDDLRQRASLWAAKLSGGEKTVFDVAPARASYLLCATGHVTVNGVALQANDGAVVKPGQVEVTASEASTVVRLDLDGP